MERTKKNLIVAAAKDAGCRAEHIVAALAILQGKAAPDNQRPPVAVRQARVCEMLDCSRFHIRKLQKMGLLQPVDVAGLRRYRITDVMKLLGE